MPSSQVAMQSSLPAKAIAVFFAAVLSLFLAAAGHAQDTVTGAFQGDVSNNVTGDPIAGVAVRITSVQAGTVYTLTTDSKGRFYQGLLPPGFYDISVTVPGFKPRLLRREIKVSLTGDIVPVPVSLEPETTPSTPPTTAEVPDDIRVEINTVDARRGDSRKKEEVQALPIGSNTITRSFDELALLTPGVSPPPQTIGDVAGPGVGPGVGSAGQFSVNGLRSRANNFTVDGSDNNDEDIGVRRQGFVALVPQPIESIEEFQITTLLAPAQFGRNIGAQVNAVSRAGGNKVTGSLYGFFNSSQLNARNVFDTTSGNAVIPVLAASGQRVVFTDGSPLTVQNQSGGKDSFSAGYGGGTLGGPIASDHAFYFFSGEYQRINATRQKSFAVPTVEQRGPFGTGATGTFRNPYTGQNARAISNTESGAALLSLFPFPNDPNGAYGANTFTQVLPASGRGAIFSGRLDDHFMALGRQHTFTARYNFTDDDKDIPAVNEAIFSSVRSKIRTNNLSVFLNSQLNRGTATGPLFNQLRFSVGHTHLKFDELRDTGFLIPSAAFPDTPFLLNAPLRFNITQPTTSGVPNAGPVRYSRFDPFATSRSQAEDLLGPVGEVNIAGFSRLGTDVYNFPQDRRNLTYQIADEVTYSRGGHAFVAGFDIRRTDLDSDLPRLSRPLVNFNGAPRLTRRPSGGTCPNGGVQEYCFPAPGSPTPVVLPVDLAALGAASDFLVTFNLNEPGSKVDLRYYQLNFYGQDTWRVRPDLSISAGLRYEYNSPVSEVNGRIESTFADPQLSLVPGLDTFIAGRTRLYDPDHNNIAPRIGVAYSPRLLGSGRVSVFRAGYGLFYDQILGAVANQSRNVFPTFLTLNLGGIPVSAGEGLLNLNNPAGFGFRGMPIALPGSLNQFNPAIDLAAFLASINTFRPSAINATLPARHMDMPLAHHYSFSFEQQLTRNYVLSVAYVGTTGRNLLRFTTPNLGASLTTSPTTLVVSPFPGTPFGTLFLPENRGQTLIPSRPVATVGGINQFETTATSSYNALQTQLTARFINRLNLQFSYTFSKATDDVSDVFDLAGAYALPQNSFDLAAERGPANFDVRHRWTYDLIYSFPRNESGGFLNHITDDLQIATTGRFHSGQPFTVNSVIDVNLDGNLTDRLNTLQGLEVTGDRQQPIRLTTDDTTSLLAPYGQDGQIGRNSFRAGNVVELDLSVIKRFPIGSNHLGFRTDIFNFIDRANYGVPVRLLEAPGFGRAVSTVTPGRRIQFAVKYEF